MALRGHYLYDGNAGGATATLANDNYIVVMSVRNLSVYDRADRDMEAPALLETEPLWSVDPREVDSVEKIPAPAIISVQGVPSVVYLIERFSTFETPSRVSIVARSLANGEVTWRHDIEAAYQSAIAVDNFSVYVRFIDNSGENQVRTLGKLPIGASSFSAVVTDFSTGYGDMVINSSSIYMLTNDGVSRYSTLGLVHEWTSDESVGFSTVLDMVARFGNVYLIQNDNRLYSLDSNGDVRWSTVLDVEEFCTSAPVMATDGEVLVVTGMCRYQVFAVDCDTGNGLWDVDSGPQPYLGPAVISGDVVYVPVSPFGGSDAEVQVYDLVSGAPITTLVLDTPSFGLIDTLMASNGLLYVGWNSYQEGPQTSTIWVYEREPAHLIAGFDSVASRSCGAHRGSSIPVRLTVTNAGPGTAFATEVVVRADFSPVDWEPPVGYSYTSLVNGFRISLGDLAPAASEEIVLHVTPLDLASSTDLGIRAQIESGVRNLFPENGRDEISFTLLDAVPENVDLWIDDIEITQVIQDQNQTIPLVAGKPTLVRVFARSTEPVVGVRAEMHLSGSTIQPTVTFFEEPALRLNDCLTVGDGGPAPRSNLGSTFNFLVPPEMLEGRPDGSFTFEIELDPDNLIPESDENNNMLQGVMDFMQMPPICLVSYSVRTFDSNLNNLIPDSRIPSDIMTRTLAMMPVRDIHVFPKDLVLEKPALLTFVPYQLDPGSVSNTTQILTRLWVLRSTTRDPAICKNVGGPTHYVGVVGEDNYTSHPDGNQFNGIAKRPGHLTIFRLRGGGTQSFNQPAAGVTLAHELGHNYGRRHVDCGDPAGPDSNYPYNPCVLSPLTGNVFFGMDLDDITSPTLVVPRLPAFNTSDLLSYAGNRWPSDYNYMAMLDRIVSGSDFEESASFLASDRIATAWMDSLSGSSGKMLLVSAFVDAQGTGTIEGLLELSPETIPENRQVEFALSARRAMLDETSHDIELLDDQGGVLASIPVEVAVIEDDEETYLMVATLLPQPDGVVGLRLVSPDLQVLDSRERSPAAPVVELLEPDASTIVDDVLVVDWTASDADGDPLTTLIQYSNDDGLSWETLATDIPEPPVALPAEMLSGAIGTARIRIIVSDGFNATEAVSPAFTVLPRDPIARITDRPESESFPPRIGGAILLRGFGFDPEDGPLEGASLSWEVETLGVVGSGTTVLFPEPPPGSYLVTLTATDSEANESTDQITLIIEEVPPPSSLWQVY